MALPKYYAVKADRKHPRWLEFAGMYPYNGTGWHHAYLYFGVDKPNLGKKECIANGTNRLSDFNLKDLPCLSMDEFFAALWTPKEGETIEVMSYDGEWVPRTFVRMYNGEYVCKVQDNNKDHDILLHIWKEARPLTPEAPEPKHKIGDWVVITGNVSYHGMSTGDIVEILTIEPIQIGCPLYYQTKGKDGRSWNFTDKECKSWEPKPGEEIEVRDYDEHTWQPRYFSKTKTDDDRGFKFGAHIKRDLSLLRPGTYWKQMRPAQNTEKKEFKVSDPVVKITPPDISDLIDKKYLVSHTPYHTEQVTGRLDRTAYLEGCAHVPVSIFKEIGKEVSTAKGKYPANFNSLHEAYAVLKEEVDELWDEIKTRTPDKARIREEAKQVAAVAIRIMNELT